MGRDIPSIWNLVLVSQTQLLTLSYHYGTTVWGEVNSGLLLIQFPDLYLAFLEARLSLPAHNYHSLTLFICSKAAFFFSFLLVRAWEQDMGFPVAG